MSRHLLKLLGDSHLNKGRGQLIFTTHDTTLLDPAIMRRDQVFFTEKTRDGATKLYSLLEYSPRKDELLQKGYLAGRYGAIPFLGELDFETTTQAAANQKAAASPTLRGKPT